MRVKSILPFIVFVLCCTQAFALRTPVQTVTRPAIEDTISKVVSNPHDVPGKKKVGFFQKLKNKVLTYFLSKKVNAEGGPSAKAVLGWTALGLVLLGIGIPMLFGGGSGFVWIAVAGFLASIVALLLKGNKNKPEETRKGNTAAAVALAIFGGLAIVGLLVLSSW